MEEETAGARLFIIESGPSQEEGSVLEVDGSKEEGIVREEVEGLVVEDVLEDLVGDLVESSFREGDG